MNFDHYYIRLLNRSDLQDYFSLIDRNRKRLEDFFAGTVAITRTLEDTRNHLEDVVLKTENKQYFPFIVIDTLGGQMVASIQVKNIDWSIPKAELGYYVDSGYEGKGITTRATGMIINYCFEELKMNKLFIRTHEGNAGSRHVAEKNGFTLEGTLRSDYKTTKGILIDALYYGRLREDRKAL